jgi:hypothetical protein
MNNASSLDNEQRRVGQSCAECGIEGKINDYEQSLQGLLI